jgi:hypothetical protein
VLFKFEDGSEFKGSELGSLPIEMFDTIVDVELMPDQEIKGVNLVKYEESLEKAYTTYRNNLKKRLPVETDYDVYED